MARVVVEVPTLPRALGEGETSRAWISARGRLPWHLRSPHKGKKLLGVFVLQQKPAQLKSWHQNRLRKALNPHQPKRPVTAPVTWVWGKCNSHHTGPTACVPQLPPRLSETPAGASTYSECCSVADRTAPTMRAAWGGGRGMLSASKEWGEGLSPRDQVGNGVGGEWDVTGPVCAGW